MAESGIESEILRSHDMAGPVIELETPALLVMYSNTSSY